VFLGYFVLVVLVSLSLSFVMPELPFVERPGAYPEAPVEPGLEPFSCISCPGDYPDAPRLPLTDPLFCISWPGAFSDDP
jgi:hypothetical protein